MRKELLDAINENNYLLDKFETLDEELIERARKKRNHWNLITDDDLRQVNEDDPKVTMIDYYNHLARELGVKVVTWTAPGNIMLNVSKLAE